MSLFSGNRRRLTTTTVKLARVADLRPDLRRVEEERIRRQYPAATPKQILLRLASLVLGREAMVRVFHWDPEKEGW
jgi:hypothetical protein